MKNRIRIMKEQGQVVYFKTYRLNYPFGRKSKATKTFIKETKVVRFQKNNRRKHKNENKLNAG